MSALHLYRRVKFDHESTGRITINGRSFAVNADFAQQAIFLAQQLKSSEKYIASILHSVMTENPNIGPVGCMEATVVELHQRRRHLVDCLRYIFEAAELAELPDAPRLYKRLDAFARQDLVPPTKGPGGDISLALRIFKKLEKLGNTVARAQQAKQGAVSNTVAPSGKFCLFMRLISNRPLLKVVHPLWATISSVHAVTHSNTRDDTLPLSSSRLPVLDVSRSLTSALPSIGYLSIPTTP